MKTILLVGLGGMIGTILRYLLGLVPVQGDLPLVTLLINFSGSFVIGMVAGFAARSRLNGDAVLFLRTGICGGFTTFSAFSLETFQLLESRKFAAAGIYATLSVVLCVAGAALGYAFARLVAE